MRVKPYKRMLITNIHHSSIDSLLQLHATILNIWCVHINTCPACSSLPWLYLIFLYTSSEIKRSNSMRQVRQKLIVPSCSSIRWAFFTWLCAASSERLSLGLNKVGRVCTSSRGLVRLDSRVLLHIVDLILRQWKRSEPLYTTIVILKIIYGKFIYFGSLVAI